MGEEKEHSKPCSDSKSLCLEVTNITSAHVFLVQTNHVAKPGICGTGKNDMTPRRGNYCTILEKELKSFSGRGVC